MDWARLEAICGGYSALRVAVFGDFCLDRYLEIDPTLEEVSIETGLAAHQVVRVRSQPGGAGTVLNNVIALGVGRVYAVGFCGEDGEGYELLRALRRAGADTDHFLQTGERCTFTYCKPLIMEEGKPPRELNRLDTKNRTPTPTSVEQRLDEHLRALIDQVDAVLIMEQMEREGYGAVTRPIKHALAQMARASGKTAFLADSRANIGTFADVMIKVNEKELADHFGLKSGKVDNPEAWIARWAHEIGQVVFVTFGADGIMSSTPDGRVERVPGIRLTGPLDIVGAGDSVSANIACALSAGASPGEAAAMGNLAGSIVVQKLGTTGTASVRELKEAFQRHMA
jgi:rfaE bifunctional protein kinase chain/domain